MQLGVYFCSSCHVEHNGVTGSSNVDNMKEIIFFGQAILQNMQGVGWGSGRTEKKFKGGPGPNKLR